MNTVFRTDGQTGGISADVLKVIAMVTMVIDHMGAVLFPEVPYLRLIGRISFPIFTWLLVMGFMHTSNLKKYLLRMGIFAVISEIPFDLAMSGNVTFQGQNIYFTLLLDIVMLCLLKKGLDEGRRTAVRFGVIAAAMLLAGVLKFDYKCTGPVLAAVFYLYVRNGKPGLTGGFLLFCMSNLLIPFVSGSSIMNIYVWIGAAAAISTEILGILAIPLICNYNGVRRWKKGKYIFYIFYPIHLLILYGISQMHFFH